MRLHPPFHWAACHRSRGRWRHEKCCISQGSLRAKKENLLRQGYRAINSQASLRPSTPIVSQDASPPKCSVEHWGSRTYLAYDLVPAFPCGRRENVTQQGRRWTRKDIKHASCKLCALPPTAMMASWYEFHPSCRRKCSEAGSSGLLLDAVKSTWSDACAREHPSSRLSGSTRPQASPGFHPCIIKDQRHLQAQPIKPAHSLTSSEKRRARAPMSTHIPLKHRNHWSESIIWCAVCPPLAFTKNLLWSTALHSGNEESPPGRALDGRRGTKTAVVKSVFYGASSQAG